MEHSFTFLQQRNFMAPKTSLAIYETIVKWLQTKENFLLITGAAGFGFAVISGKKLRKTDAYIALAKVINEKHNEELDYNGTIYSL